MVVALKTLWARKLWLLAGIVLSVLLAVVITFKVSGLVPPNFGSRAHHQWVANSQLLVDAPVSEEGDLSEPVDPAISRAAVYGSLMTSNDVVAQISKASHIPAAMIAVTGPLGTTGQRLGHASAVAPGPDGGYQLIVNTDIELPTIQITAQAPTRSAAAALSSGADQGLISYVGGIENAQGIPVNHRVIVSQLGAPSVTPVSSGIAPALVAPIAIALFAAWCFAVLLGVGFVRTWRTSSVDGALAPPVEYESVERRALRAESRSSSTLGYGSFTHSVPEIADLHEHRLGRDGENEEPAGEIDADDIGADDAGTKDGNGRRFRVRGAKRT